jgi:hypothetical protein
MAKGGSLVLTKASEKNPGDIMFVPVSALEHFTLRFDEQDREATAKIRGPYGVRGG